MCEFCRESEFCPASFALQHFRIHGYQRFRPGHFAAITDMPTFVIFGPETPALYGSLGKTTPIYAGLACSPCVSASNHRKTACMDNVCLRAKPSAHSGRSQPRHRPARQRAAHGPRGGCSGRGRHSGRSAQPSGVGAVRQPQSIYPEQFDRMMDDVEQIAPVVGRTLRRGIHIDAPAAENR